LEALPIVRQALEQAWTDSLADDPTRRHEEGGWIYQDLATGEVLVRRAPSGVRAEIRLANPPVVDGSVVVGKFHTHPNPTAEGWTPGPSPSDIMVDARHGVPDLIRADDGTHYSGPDRRRGGLGGNPGYPDPDA
jgi:hypothetical protein